MAGIDPAVIKIALIILMAFGCSLVIYSSAEHAFKSHAGACVTVVVPARLQPESVSVSFHDKVFFDTYNQYSRLDGVWEPVTSFSDRVLDGTGRAVTPAVEISSGSSTTFREGQKSVFDLVGKRRVDIVSVASFLSGTGGGVSSREPLLFRLQNDDSERWSWARWGFSACAIGAGSSFLGSSFFRRAHQDPVDFDTLIVSVFELSISPTMDVC
jgi:hypothetical protein